MLPVNFQMPSLDFAVNHYGKPDVAMFDFTSMFQSDNSCRVIERHGHRLLMSLVGDSLLEPFWPTGTGCARGFFGGLDACWLMRQVGLLFLFLMYLKIFKLYALIKLRDKAFIIYLSFFSRYSATIILGCRVLSFQPWVFFSVNSLNWLTILQLSGWKTIVSR